MPDFDPDAYLKDVTQAAAQPDDKAFDPDSYMDGELKKYVDDDTFDPLVLATEQPDKLAMAKEIEWRKSQRPMTGARAGQVAKNVVKSVPGIIKDFGAGAGAIAGDAIIQATDETPANVERAKTQQLARAQLIEQHGGGFMNKLLGPDSWFGKHFNPSQQDLIKSGASANREGWEKYAANSPDKPAALAAIDQKEKDALAAVPPPESPRQASDRQFEEKLAQVKRERELLKGIPQSDGLVAGVLKTTGDAVRELATGEQPHDDQMDVTNTFKSGPELEKMGAPVDPEAIRTGAVTADPVNLLPLHVPGMTKVAGKIGGALLKAPAAIAEKVAENTPQAVSNVLKKKVLGTAAVAGGGALTAEAIHDPAGAAKMLAAAGIATAGLAGARYFGRVMDTAGSKLLDPKFVSAAERAGAESAMNIEKAGGGQLSKFLDPAMNKADFERALVKPIQSGVTAPIAMAPLNVALSDNPEEFGSLTGTAMGFGLFSGATAYNPLKGFHPETVAAVDSILRDNGAKKKYGTALDAQHDAFMADAPEGVRDAVNSYRGFFDGFKMPNGREPQIYVLPAAEFGAEVNKRRPDVTPEHAAKQRGFAGKDGAILINGDYGGEAPGILGHEAGGHVAQSIMEVLAPEVAKSMDAAALKGLTDAKGKPTPKLKAFVDAYNKEFDPTGKTKEIQTTDHAISEWLAEQGRAVLEGQGPAKFAAGESVRANIGDNLADQFRKIFGTKRMFDRSEVPALARQYRDLLFQLGRFRTQEGPQTAPPEAAPAPGDPAAAPAGAAPAAEPAAPATGDRATVAAALRSLFGVKQAEADAMAAAATGSTVEEMIASAAQAKSKAVAGSRTTAPAAQPAPLQLAGQLAGVAAAAEPAAAPAAQLAGFGEPAAAPKAKIFVRRLPDGTFVDRQGNPVDPRTGVAPEAPNLDRGGAAAPPEAPARPVVTPEDLTSRVQAAEDAARAAEAGKKRRTPESREKATAQAVKEARIQALLDAAHETAPDEGHLQRREEFGTTKYTGRIDESIPAHRMLLDELGVSEGGRSNIDTLSANLGKPVFIRYKSAAKEGSSEAAQASGQVDRTGKQRAKEYKAESVDSRIEDAQAGDVNTGVEQTKSFYPLGFRVNPSTGSVTVTGFSPQRLLANVGKIVEFMRGKGRDTGYSGPDDPAIHDDMQGYAQNHANGYKGDGSGPIEGETPNSHYEPHVIDSTRFDLLNAAMGNESAKTPKSDRGGAKARAGDLQDFAEANNTLVTQEGETNFLRQWLNDSGFEFKNEAGETRTGTKEVLEPTIESLRVDPELMRDISTEAPEGESSLRPTGVADPSAMTAAGIPKARNVAAGFMPGHGPENGQLSNFGGEQDKPSIKSKVPQTDELGFYSRLRQHIDEADFGTSKPKAAHHWLGVIEKWAKGASTPTLGVQSRGIARDELEWSGVKEWLKSQGSEPLKKADVLNFIDHNGVQVQEIQKGGGSSSGEAYYMDDEPQDHSYAFDEHAGAWLIDAYPSSDYFGEGETDGMDSKSLAAIFLKGDKGQISYLDGKYHASLDVGRDDLGDFNTREEAQAAIDAANEEAHGAKEYEIWDVRQGHNYQVDSAATFEEATQKARELARDALQQINRSHSDGDEAGDGGTQFSGYKLSGGKNYKEILLKLPSNAEQPPDGMTAEYEGGKSWGVRNEEGHRIGSVRAENEQEAIRKAWEDSASQILKSKKQDFTESHWDEPNVVAHFRQQDFEGDVVRADAERLFTSDHPEKVRHIDEFQSDWHQKGRERGYKSELKSDIDTSEWTATKKPVNTLPWQPPAQEGDFYWEIADADGRRISGVGREQASTPEEAVKRAAQLQADQAKQQAIPDAPFKKSWSQLAFKRALKLAVEDGMDRMSWSTGDQNIEHYKNALVAEVNNITWTHPPAKDFKIVTLDTNSSGMIRFDVAPDGTISNSGGAHVAQQFEGKKLGDVIGNDNAKKILEPGEGNMDGEGMQVGGEGMRIFYDEMIPQFASKYVSKWGSKVEDVTLPNGDTVHSVKITPEMKAAVEQGQPMFMPGGRGKGESTGDLSDFGKDNPSSEREVLAHRIATAKREILADIESGEVPSDVTSFSQLHDYTDANMYINDAARDDRMIGEIGKRKGWGVKEYSDFSNKIIEGLDEWLANGRRGDTEGGEEAPKYTPRTQAGRKIVEDGFDLVAEDLYERSPDNRVIKVSKDGKQVGHIAFTLTPRNRYAHLDEVVIEPEFQKQGIGSALYREMAAELQSRRITHIGGDVVSEVPMNIRKSVFGKFDMVSDDINELTEAEARERLPATPPDLEDFDGGKVFVRNKVHPTKKFMPGQGAEPADGDLSSFGDKPSIESKVEWAQPKRAKAAGDVIVNVKTSAFDEAFQKDHGFYIDKDGNGEIKGRRDRFKEFLKEGKAIEMPEVVITKEGTAAFVNGRHRFSVMRDAGVESVPMSMDETSALRAQTLGMTVEAKSKGGDLGGFMPSDETGRGEFDVKEKKPVDERRARLMADMQGQAKWLTDRAKEKGFDSVDDLMAEDFEGYNELAKQWREEHPRFNAAGEQLFMPGKMEGATPEEREANFSKWTGDAPVIRVGDSLHDVEPGQPVVIEGFHGTTHDFTAVDTSKANIENDWGKGFYVTNTPEDVENNYAGEGPDLTQRIEKRAERVEQELEDMEPADISRVFGITPEQAQAIIDGEGKGYGTPEYKSRQEALKVIAKKELTTHGGSTMKVFVKLENPLKLGEGSGKEGYWDAETPMDEETGDPDGEPTGKLVDFIEALREVSRDYDEADIDSADDLNQLIWDGGAKPSDALAAAKKALQYATDPETGDSATSEILRAAVEQMGYDGIIDETVNDKFGSNKATGKAMTGMDDYTFHVIAFRPESVKSATGNRGTFDGSNPDMTMMPGNSARRTWFMRNGKRVYHHRGEAGQFAEKPALAKLGVSAISQKKDDNAKAQLETFK